MNRRSLTSWKEIAQYVGKAVRTIQRWEQDFGFPIRRPTVKNGHHAVIAIPDEIDAWLESQTGRQKSTEVEQLRNEVDRLTAELDTCRNKPSVPMKVA
jgi:predicted DNA-binding transcriptional regulator AlpA